MARSTEHTTECESRERPDDCLQCWQSQPNDDGEYYLASWDDADRYTLALSAQDAERDAHEELDAMADFFGWEEQPEPSDDDVRRAAFDAWLLAGWED